MKEYTFSKARRAYVDKNFKREKFLRKAFPFLYRGFKESWIDVKEIELEFSSLPENFDGYRILQFSDVHMGTWMTTERLAGIVKIINRQDPDMIAFTGDLFSYGIDLWGRALTEILSELKSKDGIVHAMGNHDYWNDPVKVRKITQQIGMIELTNRKHAIHRQGQKILFAGTDSAYVNRYELAPLLNIIKEDDFVILLSHEPDTALQSAPTGKFALQLSGHSHGGQMVLPLIGPPVRVKHAYKFPLGLYKIEEMLLYTNRGLGTSIPPIRINSKPEITLFTLQKSS